MTPERYNQLMTKGGEELTEEEFKEGWHFCAEWDYMLIGPGMPELESCLCFISPGGTCTNCED